MFRMKYIYLEAVLLLLLRPRPAFSNSGFMADFFKKFPSLPGFRDTSDSANSFAGYLDTLEYMHRKRELPVADTLLAAPQANISKLQIKSHVLLPQIVTPVTPLKPVYPRYMELKILPQQNPVKNITKLKYRLLPPPVQNTTPSAAVYNPVLYTSTIKYRYTQYTTPAANHSSTPSPQSTPVSSQYHPQNMPHIVYYSKPPLIYSPPPPVPYSTLGPYSPYSTPHPPHPYRYNPILYTTPRPQPFISKPMLRQEDPYHWKFRDFFKEDENQIRRPYQPKAPLKEENETLKIVMKDPFYYEDTKMMSRKKKKNGIVINGRGTSGEVLKYKYTLLDHFEPKPNPYLVKPTTTTSTTSAQTTTVLTTTTKSTTTSSSTTSTSTTTNITYRPTTSSGVVESQNQRPVVQGEPEPREGVAGPQLQDNAVEVSQERLLNLKVTRPEKSVYSGRKPHQLTRKRNTKKTKPRYKPLTLKPEGKPVKDKSKPFVKVSQLPNLKTRNKPFYASKLLYKKTTTTPQPKLYRPIITPQPPSIYQTTPKINVQHPRPGTGFVSKIGFSNPFGQVPYNFEDFMPLPKIVPFGIFNKHWNTFPIMDDIIKKEFPDSSKFEDPGPTLPKPPKQTYMEAKPYKYRKYKKPIKKVKKKVTSTETTPTNSTQIEVEPVTDAPELRKLPDKENDEEAMKSKPTYSSTREVPVLPKLVILQVTPTPTYPAEEFVYKTEDKELELEVPPFGSQILDTNQPFDNFFNQPFPNSDFNPNSFEETYQKGWDSFRKYNRIKPTYSSNVLSYNPPVYPSPVRHPPQPVRHASPIRYSTQIEVAPRQPQYLPHNKIIKATFFHDLEETTEKPNATFKWVGKLKEMKRGNTVPFKPKPTPPRKPTKPRNVKVRYTHG